MRRHIVLTAAAAAYLCIGPAMAGNNSQTAQPDQNKASDQNKIICESLPPPTGTRLGGRRVCMTKAQWDRQHHEAADALSRQQTLGKMGKLPGN